MIKGIRELILMKENGGKQGEAGEEKHWFMYEVLVEFGSGRLLGRA